MITHRSDLCYPVDLIGYDAARRFDPAAISDYVTNNEIGDTGWYPVGRARIWHPAIHLWMAKGLPVRSVAPGRIVCARLARADTEEERRYGSRGFVLVQHEVQRPEGDPLCFYVLYQGLTWSEEALGAAPWLRRYDLRGRFEPEDAGVALGVLNGPMPLYRYREDATPRAHLGAGTVVEVEARRPAEGGTWQRVRMHRGQCPRPERLDHSRSAVMGWLWIEAGAETGAQTGVETGAEALAPTAPTGQRVLTGVSHLRLRRTPGRGPETPVTTLRAKHTTLERLRASTVGPGGHRWQAVRVRLGDALDPVASSADPLQVEFDSAGRWAYGWVYDGSDLTSTDSLVASEADSDVAQQLDAGAVTALDLPVEAGALLGEVGPMEQDNSWLTEPDYGVHVEVFLAEDPTERVSAPEGGSEGGWIRAADDTDGDVFCDSEQITVTAENDPDVRDSLAEQFYDRAVRPLLGQEDAAIARRRVAEVEAFRRVVVRTTSEWAMDWRAAVQNNPEWAVGIEMSEEDAEALQAHMWWPEAEAAGADLPERTGGNALVYHVHPITWLQALYADLPEGGTSAYLADPAVRLRRKQADGWTTDGPAVKALQRDLHALGFDAGSVDGTYGAATQGAVVCLQIETYYHVVDGRLDPEAAFDQTSDAWIDGWQIDGIVGPGTKAAMRAWFDAELTAEYPREINVATEHPGAPMGYVMLDRGNTNGGVYHYQSGVAGDRPARDEIEWWGMPPIVYTLERVARLWADDGHPRIQIGDMTRPQGGTYWRLTDEEYVDDGREDYVRGNHVSGSEGNVSLQDARGEWQKVDHFSHKRGWVADIRPMVGKDSEVGHPLRSGQELYDQELSQSFLLHLRNAAPKNRGASMLTGVRFGDRDMILKGGEYYVPFVVYDSNHEDHYHIKMAVHLKHD